MSVDVVVGDCRWELGRLPEKHFNTCVTSPPYWGLRDYGVDGQIGLERSLSKFVDALVAVFAGVHRVLRDDGTLWLNLGDCFANSGRGPTTESCRLEGSRRNQQQSRAAAVNRSRVVDGFKKKDLIGVPWRVAFALQDAGWYLRSDIVWHKPNPMPEPVSDRPTRSHEYVFLLTKSRDYFYDADAVRTPLSAKTRTTFGTTRRSKGNDALGKVKSDRFTRSVPDRRARLRADGTEAGANLRSVWTLVNAPFRGAHFATMPLDLARLCVRAGCPVGGHVLDPFGGAGTSGVAAIERGASATLIELNPQYASMARARCRRTA